MTKINIRPFYFYFMTVLIFSFSVFSSFIVYLQNLVDQHSPHVPIFPSWERYRIVFPLPLPWTLFFIICKQPCFPEKDTGLVYCCLHHRLFFFIICYSFLEKILDWFTIAFFMILCSILIFVHTSGTQGKTTQSAL